MVNLTTLQTEVLDTLYKEGIIHDYAEDDGDAWVQEHVEDRWRFFPPWLEGMQRVHKLSCVGELLRRFGNED